MPIFKNVPSQKCLVYAYDKTTGLPLAGDAANITAYVSKDGATGVASDDVNPSPITNMSGFYAFDLTEAETNCDLIALYATSTTANIIIGPVMAYTTPRPYTESTVNDASASTTVFITSLSSSVTDYYKNAVIFFTTGALAGQTRPITGYNGSTKAITVSPALTSAPANATPFIIIGYSA